VAVVVGVVVVVLGVGVVVVVGLRADEPVASLNTA
jgi:hypothetical protein